MSPQFAQGKGAGPCGRSLHSTVKRTTQVASILIIDAASREACSTPRPSPAQALVLLVDAYFVAGWRVLAQLVLPEHGDDRGRPNGHELGFRGLETVVALTPSGLARFASPAS